MAENKDIVNQIGRKRFVPKMYFHKIWEFEKRGKK